MRQLATFLPRLYAFLRRGHEPRARTSVGSRQPCHVHVELSFLDVVAVIRDRLDRQQPLQLSAGRITLSGETLRLTGRAMIRFDDTSIRAEEIVINPTTKQIDLLGNVDTFLGADVVREVAPALPRREFR